MFFCFDLNTSGSASVNENSIHGNSGDTKKAHFFLARLNNRCCLFFFFSFCYYLVPSVTQNLLRAGLLSCSVQKIFSFLVFFYLTFIYNLKYKFLSNYILENNNNGDCKIGYKNKQIYKFTTTHILVN